MKLKTETGLTNGTICQHNFIAFSSNTKCYSSFFLALYIWSHAVFVIFKEINIAYDLGS